MSANASFAFAPDLVLRLSGPKPVIEGFRREYGAAEADGSAPDVEVTFAGEPPAGSSLLVGGHKTVRWRVSLGPAETKPLRADIALKGFPASFGRSLVQGYYVEPLLSVAAARTGRVLLPAAAFGRGHDAIVVMGRSRSGKSTLAARVGARGGTVLGDDQVFVAANTCTTFPRRSRVYPDLRQTAPAAYGGLSRGGRVALLARAAMKRLTFGWVAPSLAVEQFGGSGPASLPIAHVVLIERDPDLGALETATLDTADAVEAALELLDAQRERLAWAEPWRVATAEAREMERATLEDAFGRVGCERIRVPGAWGASEAVGALDRHLALAG